MSRNKVVKKLRDLDSLSQFLLDKVMHFFSLVDPHLLYITGDVYFCLIDCHSEQRRTAW